MPQEECKTVKKVNGDDQNEPLFVRDQHVRLRDWVGPGHLAAVSIGCVNTRRMVVLDPFVPGTRYGGRIVRVREWPKGTSWYLKECYLEPDPDRYPEG
jgi:hypothetical protein